MMQLRDTIITVGRRVMPEMGDSELVQFMVAKSVHVDEIELLPLKEIAINKAVDIKVDKLDTIEPINISHPSFESEAKQYYAEYKTSITYEKPIETNDMNTLVHDVNAYFVIAFFVWKFFQSLLPRLNTMVTCIYKVWKGEVV